ncbi:hypothetical protein NVV99_23585 [Rhodococcus sp. PAE-6]|uniref:DUF6924 domain-containing protein n=1 Tax=Rhodococcus sp. PAE-6 TaxID=2972477 RepID=UPI0021B31E84|nr:hypothetical protein [Rhodococcus sp. PAE-6]MCT7293891.1 hypothetical protein [Rhodococcus sp. PAE-6]
MTFPDVDIPLLRLDYSNEQAWNDVLHAALGEESERTDPLTIVDDPAFDGIDIDELLARLNENDPGYRFLVIADTRTLTETDHPFTLVTATSPPHRLPIAAHTVSDVVANLWLSNLDIEDYLTAADPDGVYRATPPQRTEPQERTIEVEKIVDAIGDGPWPGTLEEFRVGLLEYRARSGFRVVATLVDTQRVRKNRSLRPLSGYLKYWDVYGHESYTEYLASLSEERQVLSFEFSLMSGDPNNHWRAILDPSTLRVLAAERWIKRST